MKLSKTALAFALAIQLGIVAVVLAARAGSDVDPEPFLRFDPAAIDAVAVSNADGDIRLVKREDEWQLPAGVPADAEKVADAIDKLADAAGRWPVANSASTAERFEVTEDNHQRHIVLAAGEETVADVYLGTSPGYRKVHARRADDDAVYAIAFANYEAGVTAEDWLDRALLQAEGTVTGVRRDGAFELAKDEDDNWTAAGGETLDAGKATTLAGRFTGLSVTGISEATLPDAPYATFGIDDEAGELALSLYRIPQAPAPSATGADDEEPPEVRYDYVATSNRVPGAYALSSYVAEQMAVTLADLAPEPEEAATAAAPDAEEPAGGSGDEAGSDNPSGEGP